MNPQNPTHADPLVEQLRILNEAAQNLERQWSLTEDDGNHPIVMSNKYPFDESFDEIAAAISEWYQATANYQSIENTDLQTQRT